jgi:hypothetical protein
MLMEWTEEGSPNKFCSMHLGADDLYNVPQKDGLRLEQTTWSNTCLEDDDDDDDDEAEEAAE